MLFHNHYLHHLDSNWSLYVHDYNYCYYYSLLIFILCSAETKLLRVYSLSSIIFLYFITYQGQTFYIYAVLIIITTTNYLHRFILSRSRNMEGMLTQQVLLFIIHHKHTNPHFLVSFNHRLFRWIVSHNICTHFWRKQFT